MCDESDQQVMLCDASHQFFWNSHNFEEGGAGEWSI